jgi:hypothetical protein
MAKNSILVRFPSRLGTFLEEKKTESIKTFLNQIKVLIIK